MGSCDLVFVDCLDRKQPCMVSLYCCPGVILTKIIQESSVVILLPLLPKCWDYRCEPSRPVHGVLGLNQGQMVYQSSSILSPCLVTEWCQYCGSCWFWLSSRAECP